jgi:hypothetical protein
VGSQSFDREHSGAETWKSGEEAREGLFRSSVSRSRNGRKGGRDVVGFAAVTSVTLAIELEQTAGNLSLSPFFRQVFSRARGLREKAMNSLSSREGWGDQEVEREYSKRKFPHREMNQHLIPL